MQESIFGNLHFKALQFSEFIEFGRHRDSPMLDDSEDPAWLYRGVPVESHEVEDVRATGEIEPPNLARRGEIWRSRHCADVSTETAYTSWTSDRSIAVDAALAMADRERLSGRQVIFRVKFDTIPSERWFDGRADEFEYLIEGVVENVESSEDDADEEETQ